MPATTETRPPVSVDTAYIPTIPPDIAATPLEHSAMANGVLLADCAANPLRELDEERRALEESRKVERMARARTMGLACRLVALGVLTQTEAAERAGVDRQSIRRYLGLSQRGRPGTRR